MKLKIASAFGHRHRPTIVTSVAQNSTLGEDSRHFKGKDWTQVTALDWAEHSDAFFGFAPAAFAYFLPSLLITSLDTHNMPLIAADALVATLDTSADPDLWDDWFRDRFLRLTSAELRAIEDWSEVG